MKNLNNELLNRFDVTELEDRFEMKRWADIDEEGIVLNDHYIVKFD